MVERKIVIIGNGAAALSAVRAMRGISLTHRITLISREGCCAYSPVLTTYYLSDRMQEKNLFIADEAFYRNADVECVLGKEVWEVDASKRVVVLDDGKRIEYDYLLIATGASPKTLEGIDSDIARDLCYLRTIEDARRIKGFSKRAKEIVIVGAGLVSMQIANALYKRGVHLTFVVGSKQVLTQNIDEDCAAIVQGQIKSSSDSSFLFGRNLSKLDKKNGKYEVLLDTGEELIADMVIVGKGVKPNTQLVKNNGIRTNKGILVDERMRTSVEGIYAAGDVTEGENRVTGKVEPVPNWINACEQGRIAGLNMVGVDETFRGSVTENVTHLFGLTIVSIGMTKISSEDKYLEELRVMDLEKKIYKKMVVSGNRLMGAILLGDIQDVGVIRNIIISSVNISPFKSYLPKIPLNYGKSILSYNMWD